jgi:hypothetical protein
MLKNGGSFLNLTCHIKTSQCDRISAVPITFSTLKTPFDVFDTTQHGPTVKRCVAILVDYSNKLINITSDL